MGSPPPPVPRPREVPPSFVVVADLRSDVSMGGENVLAIHLEQLLQAQDGMEVSVHWRGIEPAPEGPRRFRAAVATAERVRRPGVHVRHLVSTDAEPLGEEWAECLAEHRAVVNLEVQRTDALGRSEVVAVIALLDRHHVDVNVVCSVHSANVRQPLDLYRFLRDDCGAQSIEWVPVVERLSDGVTARSVSGDDWGRFLISVFDEWVHRDVGEVIVTNFDAALGKWMGRTDGPCIFEETCGHSLSLTADGTLFSCGRFEDDAHRLGNIGQTHMVELIAKPEQVRFGLAKRASLPAYCLECPVKFACNGECPKRRFARTPDGEEGLNHLCAGYRAFFTHIDRPMRRMVELVVAGRYIEEVMDDVNSDSGRGAR